MLITSARREGSHISYGDGGPEGGASPISESILILPNPSLKGLLTRYQNAGEKKG